MKLVSLNSAQPTEITHNGRVIKTAIFKKPVNHALIVEPLNLQGDGQADLKNHGGEHKAIYGFSAHHYLHWRQQLNRPDLSYGQFGENLTIDNLDEKSLCIGDQIIIGECILEVTQPRVPCMKLGIALSDKSMPKQFVKHGFTGIYFRVKQTGAIETGNEIHHHFKHPARLSVYDLFNAYFDPSFINAKDVMLTAESLPQLSDEWRQKVLSKLEN